MSFSRKVIATTRLVFFCLLYGMDTYGQPDTAGRNTISYAGKIMIKANGSTRIDQYILRQHTGPDLVLQSNNEYKCFLSLDYEIFGFSYGFSPKIFTANDDNDLKGKSSFTNYRFVFFPGQWLQTAALESVKGFYAVNTGDYIPGWQKGTDPYLQLPSLTSSRLAFSTSYIFNRDFSLKSILYQTEWQQRSAGSFVPVLAYDMAYTSFNESGLQSAQRDFNGRLGLGYYYNLVIAGRFFVAPHFTPSIGIRYSRTVSTELGITSWERNTHMVYFLEGGLRLGFNSRKWVTGAGLNLNYNWFRVPASGRVSNDLFYGVVYIGYRLNEPRVLNRAYRKFKKIVPFL